MKIIMVSDTDYFKEALLMVKKGKYLDKHSGICSNLCDALSALGVPIDGVVRAVGHLLQDNWPKATDDSSYPIPHASANPSYAYSKHNLWDRRTQYGKNRWEALDVLIENSHKVKLIDGVITYVGKDPSSLLIKLTLLKLKYDTNKPELGICDSLAYRLGDISIEYSIGLLLKDHWYKFSGDLVFPIPSGEDDVDPVVAYVKNVGSFWDTDKVYGRLRVAALRIIIMYSHLLVINGKVLEYRGKSGDNHEKPKEVATKPAGPQRAG